ncbi:MAG: penicillin-binding transpeptidase domain-containing protein, partial [Bacteroidota bacterium]|nr:penicillin-binding transpeptidase domain-containing protein [Bacteroidota bacterium]
KVIPDTSFIIKWDGPKNSYNVWNQDHSLKSAFQNSVVWYYIELAKRAGPQTMQKYYTLFNYGNRKANGGKRAFWLDGNIRISVNEQIEFLKKLYFNKLPVSIKNQELVKDIMINEKTEKYVLRAKTGMGLTDGKYFGWFVGYLEQNNNVYFFALNINTMDGKTIFPDRIEYTKQCLKALGLL